MAGPLIAPLDEHNQRLLAQVHPDNWNNPDPAPIYDLVVIGGGTAGLVCAAGAAGLGARVAIVERGLLGGDCLNTGCVPSKALLRSARAVAEARAAVAVGVRTTTAIDFGAVMARVRARRADLAHNDSAARLASLGVHVFLGQASFSGARTVTVDDGSERTRPTGATLRFRRAVVASGGRPSIPSIPALASTPYLTSETLFSLTELPRRLLVIGAGAIGCEMAQAFSLLGSQVTLVDTAPRILAGEDEDAARVIAARLTSDGVKIVTGVGGPEGPPLRPPIDDLISSADTVLVATGRSPNVEGLNLEAAGVQTGPEGIHVDDRLRTSNPRVYAAGDVCSRFKFTHAADAMARVVIQNALFFGRRRASALVIPWVTYTFPEVAHVGVLSDEAITIPLTEVDRAVIDDETEGFVRMHHDRGRITGATFVATHAGELIGHVADVMRRGGTVGDFSAMVFPYPTVAEGLRKSGDTYRRRSLTPRLRRILASYFRLTRR